MSAEWGPDISVTQADARVNRCVFTVSMELEIDMLPDSAAEDPAG
jgi:hypothetical protein